MGRVRRSRSLYKTNNNIPYTRMYHADLDIDIYTITQTEILNSKIQEIIDNYAEPFSEGRFAYINSNYNSFEEYVSCFKDTMEQNSCHKLAIMTMTAALNAKSINAYLDIEKCRNSMLTTQITELKQEIIDLKQQMSDELRTVVGLEINMKIEVQKLNLIPYIAGRNIYLGWYYFLYGYDPKASLDIEKYCYVKEHVDSLGAFPTNGRKYAVAYVELLKLIQIQNS